MRVPTRRKPVEEMRRRLMRLDGLPLRPITARSLIGSLPDEPDVEDPDELAAADPHSMRDLDPGWVLAGAGNRRTSGQLALIAERSWWPPGASSGPLADILNRLWRHSVAVGIVARRLAREAGDPDPEAVGRAGQLCGLGWWAVAAVDPEWLASWWRQDDPGLREPMERADLGSDLDDLGRRLAERWGCDPLVVDAAWLHADRGGALNLAAASPERLAIIQEAYRSAEQTPWSLRGPDRETMPDRAPAADPDGGGAGPLRRPVRRPDRHAARGAGDAAERPAAAAGRPAPARPGSRRALPRAPGRVAPGRVARGMGRPRGHDVVCRAGRRGRADLLARRREGRDSAMARSPRAPGTGRRRRPRGATRTLRVSWSRSTTAVPRGPWPSSGAGAMGRRGSGMTARRRPGAWGAWAALLADRSRLERRLQAAVASLRDHVQGEDERLRRAEDGRARGVRGGRRPRAEQPAGRDRRPRPVAPRQGGGPRGRALAPHHPRPGPAGPPDPPRPDVRGAPARPAAAGLQAAGAAGLGAVGVRAGMPGAGGPAGLGAGRLAGGMPGAIPTASATSPRSCSATPCRPRRPAAGSSSARRTRTTS